MNTKVNRVFPIVVGNVLEWYDFALYGFFATIISQQFFPLADSRAALLASTATFGVAFLMRPVGALVFGAIGDKYGRKSALTGTIILMALGTAMIAFAPTYAQAGIWGTLIVVLGRLLQGFSAAGEPGAAISILIESTPSSRRGRAAALFALGMYGAVVLGTVSALAVSSLLPDAAAQEWGWRLPFIAGLLIVPVGLYTRRALLESTEFYQSKLESLGPGSVHNSTLSGIAQCAGLAAFGTASMYLVLIFMPAYAEHELDISRQDAMLSTFLSSLLLVFMLLPSGWLSDRLGKRFMVAAASLVAGLLVVPLFMYVNHVPSFGPLFSLQMTLATCMAGYAGGVSVLFASLFPTRRRATGVGLGYSLGILLFGAFAPLLTTWLIGATGSKLVPAVYVSVTAALTFTVTIFMRERQ